MCEVDHPLAGYGFWKGLSVPVGAGCPTRQIARSPSVVCVVRPKMFAKPNCLSGGTDNGCVKKQRLVACLDKDESADAQKGKTDEVDDEDQK